MKINITNLLLTLGIIGLLVMLHYTCNYKNNPNYTIIHDTIWKYDTAWIEHIIDNTKPTKYIINTVEVKIPSDTILDTMYIITHYKDKKHYNREIVNDSNLTFILNDSIQENKIFYTDYKYKINRPIGSTVIKHKDKYQVKLGGFSVINTTPNEANIDLGINGSLQKDNIEYEAGYGLINKTIMGSIKYTIYSK